MHALHLQGFSVEVQRLTWIQRFVATTRSLTNTINMERKWLAASSVMQVSAQKTSFFLNLVSLFETLQPWVCIHWQDTNCKQLHFYLNPWIYSTEITFVKSSNTEFSKTIKTYLFLDSDIGSLQPVCLCMCLNKKHGINKIVTFLMTLTWKGARQVHLHDIFFVLNCVGQLKKWSGCTSDKHSWYNLAEFLYKF